MRTSNYSGLVLCLILSLHAQITYADTAPVSQSKDNASLDIVFWESVRNSRRVSELEAYLTQFPAGAFAALAKGRIADIKTAGVAPDQIPTAVTQQVAVAGGSFGTLVMRDSLSRQVRNLEVTVQSVDAGKTVYSSGDVIASDGAVQQVRIGEAVVQVVSGALWTIPLRAGTSGSANIRRIDVSYKAPGKLTWKAVDLGEGKVQIQANVSYLVENSYGRYSILGRWFSVFRGASPLPESFVANVSGASAGGGREMNKVSGELISPKR
jgi:hypothetical protein